jgi:AAHS family 4-hydroxybenzoate transporter-like MFS transporter
LTAGRASGDGARRAALVITITCAIVYFFDGLVHTILGPLAPAFARDLSLDGASLGPIFSANLMGQCIGLVLFPPIAARYGDRWTIALTLAGFGVAQSVSGMVSSGSELFWARLVTGLFLGGCLPSCLAMVAAVAPEQRRGIAITALFTGYGLGAAMTGIAVVAFSGLGGWREVMMVIGLLCVLFAVAAAFLLRDAPGPSAKTVTGSAPSPLALLAPRYRLGTLMLWLVFIAMLTISYCLSSWLPLLLVRSGYDGDYASLALSIFSFGGIAAALLVGMLIDRFGAFRVLTVFLVIAAMLFPVAAAAIGSGSALVLQLVLALCGFFALGAYGGVNVVLASFYSPMLRSTGIGWAKSVGRIGTVAAPIMIGFQLEAGLPEPTILASFAAPALLAGFALIVIARFTTPAHATDGETPSAQQES